MITHSQYADNYPIPLCCTELPKPRREVACNKEAVRKATRTISHMTSPKPLNAGQLAYMESMRQKRIAKFSKLKGVGPMTEAQIAKFLGIGKSNAKNKIRLLCEYGYIRRTKTDTVVVFEWID